MIISHSGPVGKDVAVNKLTAWIDEATHLHEITLLAEGSKEPIIGCVVLSGSEVNTSMLDGSVVTVLRLDANSVSTECCPAKRRFEMYF